jgi:hypothetical protein
MRWPTSVLSLLVLACFSLQAQRVSFGVKGGLTALNGFDAWGLTSITRMRANAWDVAALSKYSGSHGTVRPYVAAGWVFRTFSSVTGTDHTFGTDPYARGAFVYTTSPVEGKFNVPSGPTAGAGFQFRTGRLRFGPEVRYTRWLSRSVEHQGDQYWGFNSLFSSQNQVDFLLGLSF